MKPVINEKQKTEIEALAVEHSDALIAMGADLYRQGLIKGAIIGGLGVATGFVVSIIKSAKKETKMEQDH
jgi:hypothetical protein